MVLGNSAKLVFWSIVIFTNKIFPAPYLFGFSLIQQNHNRKTIKILITYEIQLTLVVHWLLWFFWQKTSQSVHLTSSRWGKDRRRKFRPSSLFLLHLYKIVQQKVQPSNNLSKNHRIYPLTTVKVVITGTTLLTLDIQ